MCSAALSLESRVVVLLCLQRVRSREGGETQDTTDTRHMASRELQYVVDYLYVL